MYVCVVWICRRTMSILIKNVENMFVDFNTVFILRLLPCQMVSEECLFIQSDTHRVKKTFGNNMSSRFVVLYSKIIINSHFIIYKNLFSDKWKCVSIFFFHNIREFTVLSTTNEKNNHCNGTQYILWLWFDFLSFSENC